MNERLDDFAAEEQTQNILHRPMPSLSWESEHVKQSLQKLHGYVTSEARAAILWYLKKKRVKKRGAQFLRVIAIISIAISGVIPLLSQVTSVNGLFLIAPGWASISLVIGVSAIGIDRFFGFSTAWMRYLQTELLIQRLLQNFSVDWERQCIALEDRSPSKEEVQSLVMMCKEFLSKTNDIVLNETNEWMVEFRGNITDLDAAFEMPEGKSSERQQKN
jgi:hypothetical protein